MEDIPNKKEESDWKFNLGAFIVIVLTLVGGFMVITWLFNWVFSWDDSEEPQEVYQLTEEQGQQIENDLEGFDERLLKIECEIKGGEILTEENLTTESVEKLNYLHFKPSSLCSKGGLVYLYNYKQNKWIYSDNKVLK